jgi:hypothetical protein
MPLQRISLSARLKLTVFVGASGKPKRYAVSKVRGREDRLGWTDDLLVISFRVPDETFQTFLKRDKVPTRPASMGSFLWIWSPDGVHLRALGEGEFHFTREEATALDSAIYEGVTLRPDAGLE